MPKDVDTMPTCERQRKENKDGKCRIYRTPPLGGLRFLHSSCVTDQSAPTFHAQLMSLWLIISPFQDTACRCSNTPWRLLMSKELERRQINMIEKPNMLQSFSLIFNFRTSIRYPRVAGCVAYLLQLPLSVLYQASEPQQQWQSGVIHPGTR